jgi:hypothetical protein
MRLVLAAAAALLLASCEHPAVPVQPAPAPLPAPTVHRPVASTWVFHTGDVCTATAGSPELSLEVTASSGKLVLTAHGTAMPARAAVPIAFAGTSGSWTVTGHVASGHRVIASRAMTDDGAGQILVLLAGGVVTVGNRNDGLPRLRVPNSGVPGRDWFECVRRRLFL